MKKIVIFAYSDFSVNYHKQVLDSIFKDQIAVSTWLVSDHSPEKIEADLALFVSTAIFNYAALYLPPDVPKMTINYTIEKETIDRIKAITETTVVSVAAYTDLILNSRRLLLTDMGIARNRVEVFHLGDPIERLRKNVVFFGMDIPPELQGKDVISIPSRMISISNILEIALLCGIDCSKNPGFIRYCNQVYPFHGSNDYEYIADETMGDTATGKRDTVIRFNSNYAIHYMNEAAEELIGRNPSQYYNRKIFEIVPFLKKYDEASIENFGEQVLEYKGRMRIVRIEMKELHGYLSGCIFISDYWSMQKRHDQIERKAHKKSYKAKYTFQQIIGTSDKLQHCKTIAKRMARSNESVLIQGESGVGKEVFAQAIHNASERSGAPFVAINCGAMVDTLLESELFGYEEGAFTGAKKGGHQGFFEVANHGTLFLDEIGEIPLHLQARLLRVLQEHELTRVGGVDVIPIDVRIIAATNRNLKQMVQEKRFRSDLYYRINVLPIHIPSLAERSEDIELLVNYFREMKQYTFDISDDAMRYIKKYSFEGNIRELENCLSFLSNLEKKVIEICDLPEYMREEVAETAAEDQSHDQEESVLKAIGYLNFSGRGAGRRSVGEWLREHGVLLSESEVRMAMRKLEAQKLIEIRTGRGGCRLTQKGIERDRLTH